MANPRIDDLRKRLDKEPASRIFAQLAEELRKEGELAEAIEVCREGLQRHSNYPSARMTLGRALFDSGDPAAARREFELVLKGAPDNILASRLLGESLEGLGELEAARDRYKTTLAMAPGEKHVAAQLETVEKALKDKASRAAHTQPIPLQPAAAERIVAAGEPPPIKVVEVDEPMELERPHEASPVSFTATEPAPAPPAASPAVTLQPEAEEVVEFDEAPTLAASASELAQEMQPATLPIGTQAPVFGEPVAAEEAPLEPAPRAATVFVAPAPVVAETVVVPEATPAPEPEVEPEPEPEPEPSVEPEPEPEAAQPEPVPAAPAAVEPAPPPAPPPPAAPLPPPTPEPVTAQPPAPVVTEEIASVTLAELYFNQGFADKAQAVLKQLLLREPANERARTRLAEIEARESRIQVEQAQVASVVGPGVDARALRRQAIVRTVAQLEKMLAALRKG